MPTFKLANVAEAVVNHGLPQTVPKQYPRPQPSPGELNRSHRRDIRFTMTALVRLVGIPGARAVFVFGVRVYTSGDAIQDGLTKRAQILNLKATTGAERRYDLAQVSSVNELYQKMFGN